MSEENSLLTPEESVDLQTYNDATQKAHEGLTADNNKRIRLTLTKRQFVLAGIPLLFFSCLVGIFLGALFFEPILMTIQPNIINEYKGEHLVSSVKHKELKSKYDQQGGRIADLNKTIDGLKVQIYDTNYLPAFASDDVKKQIMYQEARHCVAENLRPINLRKYLGLATESDWFELLVMSLDRRSWRVWHEILLIQEVVAMPSIAKKIEGSHRLSNYIAERKREFEDVINNSPEETKKSWEQLAAWIEQNPDKEFKPVVEDDNVDSINQDTANNELLK